MPRTSATDPALVEKAVKALQKHPTLSIREAMILAEFPPEKINNKSTQRIILRHLPGQGKRKFIQLQTIERHPSSIGDGNSIAILPLTDPTTTSSLAATSTSSQEFSEPLQKKLPCNRLNSHQKQHQRMVNLLEKADVTAAHKAATIMFNEEREKGKNGMSIRKVAEHIKSVFKGKGPSATTIHKYVVKDKLVGVSPQKKGPDGDIPPLPLGL